MIIQQSMVIHITKRDMQSGIVIMVYQVPIQSL